MPLTSAFTPCGLLEFSGETSDAENIYNALVTQLGSSFDLTPGTYAQAKVYAAAMQMAWARRIIKRVPREMHPLTCYDLLTTLEKDWGCIPSAKDTILQRQLRVAARKMLMRGSREEAIVTDLQAALGSGFLKLNAIPSGDVANYPSSNPGSVGTFPLPNLAPKFYRAGSVVGMGLACTASWTSVNGSAPPVVGEKLTLEPDIAGWSEAVTVSAVTYVFAAGTPAGSPSSEATSGTFTATCQRAHSANGWAVTDAPLWLSNQYQLQVVITAATASNAELRRQAHEVMARHCKSCERWTFTVASSSTQVGPFIFGVGFNQLGSTALGASPTNF